MKKNITSVLFLCASVTFFFGCKRENMNERIHREAIEFTQKNCPKEIDEYTIIDSACYDMENKVYTYSYTVRNALDTTVVYTDELRQSFSQTLLREIKNSIEMKPLKDQGITFSYKYFSEKNGELLLEIQFPKETYQ